jgi:hypothetical protein
VAIVLSAAMVLVIGQGLKVVIDEGFSRGQEKLLDATLASLAGLIAVLGVLTWFRVYNVYWIGARFTADLRQRVYDHLLKLSPGFYEEARTGEVASRVTNDVTLIEAVMGGTLLYALRMAITMVGCVMPFTSTLRAALAWHAGGAAADRAVEARAGSAAVQDRLLTSPATRRDPARDPHGAVFARGPRERDFRRTGRGVFKVARSAPARAADRHRHRARVGGSGCCLGRGARRIRGRLRAASRRSSSTR